MRQIFRREIGPQPQKVDDLDATVALVCWAKRRRGFEYSTNRAQLWEFVVEIVDAALWLGWLLPNPKPRKSRRPVKDNNKRLSNQNENQKD